MRNAAVALDDTLRSLESLEYSDIELIVIDGASTDQTIDVIKNHQSCLNYWISEPDGGLYDAMNKGIEAATGDFLWFVNAGDFPYESDVLNKIFNNSDAWDSDVIFGEAMILSESHEPMGLRSKKLPRDLTWRSLKKGMVVCHQAFLARRSIAPLYCLKYKYVADIDWVIEVLRRSVKITNSHQVLCKFVEGGISTQHRRKSLRERFKVMRKHYKLVPTILAHINILMMSMIKKSYRKQK